MSTNINPSILGFDAPYIRVIVISNQRLKVIRCKVDQNKVEIKKDLKIGFKTENVGMVWVRVPPRYRHAWVQAIIWREGTSNALSWSPQIGEDFIPPLTQKENANMIQRMVAEAKAKGGKLLTSGQFWAIMIGLGIVGALVLAVLMGFQIDVSTTPAVTPQPTLPPLPTPIR